MGLYSWSRLWDDEIAADSRNLHRVHAALANNPLATAYYPLNPPVWLDYVTGIGDPTPRALVERTTAAVDFPSFEWTELLQVQLLCPETAIGEGGTRIFIVFWVTTFDDGTNQDSFDLRIQVQASGPGFFRSEPQPTPGPRDRDRHTYWQLDVPPHNGSLTVYLEGHQEGDLRGAVDCEWIMHGDPALLGTNEPIWDPVKAKLGNALVPIR